MDVREQRVDALRRIAEECLAGRLVTRARLCKQVKNSLELLEWRKESVKIRPVKLPDGEEEPDGQRTLALALAPAGVRGVQELLSRNEPCESQDLKPEGSIPRQQQQQQQHQQQQQPLVAATQKSPEHRRTAARQLLATMLREGSVRFSPGLPCEVELGEAFPRSASAPEEAPVFTLPPVGSVKQNLANASGNGNGDKHGFVFAELFAVGKTIWFRAERAFRLCKILTTCPLYGVLLRWSSGHWWLSARLRVDRWAMRANG
jgi:hypothetical protein